MMFMRNIKFEELESFYNSLGVKERLWGLSSKPLLGADFVTGARGIDNELAGVGGITKSFGLIPSLFIVVEAESQGKGLGNQIMTNILDFARQNFSYLTLDVGDSEDYAAARYLYCKYGFKSFYEEHNRRWMCILFNRKGEIICKFLPLIYFTYRRIIHLSWLARILHSIDEYFLRR